MKEPEANGRRPREGDPSPAVLDLKGRTAHAESLKVIELYAQGGKGLRAVCRKVGVAHSTFLTRVSADPALADQYARARELADAIEFEALVEIADQRPPRNAEAGMLAAWTARQRLRVDTRKWQLARKQPCKYGDRTHLEHSGRLGLEALVGGDPEA